MIIKEACVENFTDIPRMISAGANRIELNNNLTEGGTTPSYGVIQQSVYYAHNHDIPVIVMIRPRGGNFIYNHNEIEMMKTDLKIASLLNADGVAFGCLNNNHQLDVNNMEHLVNLSHELGLKVVMHMAFDEIFDQECTIKWLINHHVQRILTHGGVLNQSIFNNFQHLKEIIHWAQNKIEILPGGGINVNNEKEVIDALKVNQVHGTKIVLMD